LFLQLCVIQAGAQQRQGDDLVLQLRALLLAEDADACAENRGNSGETEIRWTGMQRVETCLLSNGTRLATVNGHIHRSITQQQAKITRRKNGCKITEFERRGRVL
jgi:hypothetical protein